jgi:uncharacterized membrane protein YjjP (DUF1212 family)
MSILFIVTMLSIVWISFVFTMFILVVGMILREGINRNAKHDRGE